VSAFFAGTCLINAIWCAVEWSRDRGRFNAFCFWLNVGAFVANAAMWAAS
jgi:hypothetical protein